MGQKFMRRKKTVFQREEFMKGGNPTVTQLLNLSDVQDVSANSDAFKVSLDRPFDLIKE